MAQPIPDSYRRVTPCLTVLGAAKALEFYAAVLGAAERRCFPGPGGTILPAEVQIGDCVVMISDESSQRQAKAPPSGGLPGFSGCLFLDAEDAGTVIACAVELGATLYRPAQDQFYGDRDGVHHRSVRGTGGPSRRTWRMCLATRWRGGWPSCTARRGSLTAGAPVGRQEYHRIRGIGSSLYPAERRSRRRRAPRGRAAISWCALRRRPVIRQRPGRAW